jgi:hypothetical protein
LPKRKQVNGSAKRQWRYKTPLKPVMRLGRMLTVFHGLSPHLRQLRVLTANSGGRNVRRSWVFVVEHPVHLLFGPFDSARLTGKRKSLAVRQNMQ